MTISGDDLWTVGDSITEGKPDPNPSYRHYLVDRSFPGRSVRARTTGTLVDRFGHRHDGVSGRTANAVLTNLPTMYAALPTPPRHMLLHIGTNSIFAGVGAATTKSQVQQIVDFAVAHDILVWLSLILPRADAFAADVPTYNAQLQTVTGCAEIFNCGLASWWSNGLCIGSDNLHPTPHCDYWHAREFLTRMRAGGVDI